MAAQKKRKVLIIDDDPLVCKLVSFELNEEGYAVQACQDGLAGLNIAKQTHPDLLILDLDLPGLSGEAVCKELKKDKACEDIPIIMLTGKDTDADKVIGKVIGATYYIAKPFDKKDMLDKVRACLP